MRRHRTLDTPGRVVVAEVRRCDGSASRDEGPDVAVPGAGLVVAAIATTRAPGSAGASGAAARTTRAARATRATRASGAATPTWSSGSPRTGSAGSARATARTGSARCVRFSEGAQAKIVKNGLVVVAGHDNGCRLNGLVCIPIATVVPALGVESAPGNEAAVPLDVRTPPIVGVVFHLNAQRATCGIGHEHFDAIGGGHDGALHAVSRPVQLHTDQGQAAVVFHRSDLAPDAVGQVFDLAQVHWRHRAASALQVDVGVTVPGAGFEVGTRCG